MKKALMIGLILICCCFIKPDTVKGEALNSHEEPPYKNRWNLVLTEEECINISKIVELEYGNGSYEAKCAVAETILNRVVDPRFPNSVEEVISSPGQFSTYKRIGKCIPSEDTNLCVVDVLFGKTNVLPMDYVYFNNQPIGKDIIQIGGHYHGR